MESSWKGGKYDAQSLGLTEDENQNSAIDSHSSNSHSRSRNRFSLGPGSNFDKR
jgi:hypothetical protein